MDEFEPGKRKLMSWWWVVPLIACVFPFLVLYFTWPLWVTFYKAQPLPTVAGPEYPSAFAELRGSIAYAELDNQIELVRLPDLERRSIPTGERVWTLSGPNHDGWLAVAELSNSRYKISIVQVNGVERFALEETRAAPDISLAPSGTRLALVGEVSEGLGRQRALTIVDMRDPTSSLSGPACAGFISWMPDGRRLIYAKNVAFEDLPHSDAAEAHIRSRGERGVPFATAVCSFEIETGVETVLLAGTEPVLSTTGRKLIARRSRRGGLVLFDLETAQETALALPGMFADANGAYVRVLALIDDRIAFHEALPTEGQELRYTRSPGKVQAPMWSGKLTDLKTGRFWTVIPHVGYHTAAVTYGH